jgi:2'-5' RNA ligase
VAVSLPAELRERLHRATRQASYRGKVRWTRPENVHLTLKFLGETPEESLTCVLEALEEVRERHAPLRLEVSGLGAFSSPRRARVIWAGVSGEVGRLEALADDVDETLHRRAGLERESREYRPHVTLGRAAGRPVAFEPESVELPPASFAVESFELVRSDPGPEGVRYTALRSYRLDAGAVI